MLVNRWVLVGVAFGVAIAALAAGLALGRPGGPPEAAATGAQVIEIVAGGAHTCALFDNTTVKCWGDNTWGQLGDGTSAAMRTSPVEVCASGSGAGCAGGGSLTGIIAIAAGGESGFHTCALNTDNGVMCWGANNQGQLGIGTQDTNAHPLPIHVSGMDGVSSAAIAAGKDHSCAALSSGEARCWGDNTAGALGDGLAFDVALPATVCATGSAATCAALGDVVDIAAGIDHTCALMSNGGVKCWGQNSENQVGDGTAVHPRPSPTDVCQFGSGAGCALLSGVSDIDAGGRHSCALMSNGGAKCWGLNFRGQLGEGTAFQRANPFDVCATGVGTNCAGGVALTGIDGLSLGDEHSCAALSNGGARCWGRNASNQLGDGTTTDWHNPVAVCADLPCVALSGVEAVAAGTLHTCAIASGAVLCWGDNAFGQLGDGSTTDSPLPAPVLLKDSDGDGCSDAQELGLDATEGGRRDPNNLWDFFDVPTGAPPPARDRAVTAGDIAGVVARFGATGKPGDPLSPPPPAPAYHSAYERGGILPGGEPWDLQPADGSITAGDIAASVAQFGHSCA
ncbi:MAG: flexitail domain-containing putative surface protein [Dehalococcoidia bacterium]